MSVLGIPGITQVFLPCDKKPGEPWTSEDIRGLFQAIAEKKELSKNQDALLFILVNMGLRLHVKKEELEKKDCQELIAYLRKLRKNKIIRRFRVVRVKP